VEADLQRFYGLDLADMWRGKLTVRKVAVLVANLPPGAQTWVDYGGPLSVAPEVEATYSLEGTLNHIAWLFGGKQGQPPEMRDYPPLTDTTHQAAPAMDKAAKWKAREAERQRKLQENTE
jgi:hypothetical protein